MATKRTTAAKKAAEAPKVDETVVNQENPGTSEKDRSPENDSEKEAPVAKMAAAHKVDETVVNQESPGSTKAVDRNPGPDLVESRDGFLYDYSKTPDPQLVEDDRTAEKNRIRQTQSVMDAAEFRETSDDADYVEVEFLESGFTVNQRVWKKGEVLREADNDAFRRAAARADGSYWFDMNAEDQKKSYGKVMFEKR